MITTEELQQPLDFLPFRCGHTSVFKSGVHLGNWHVRRAGDSLLHGRDLDESQFGSSQSAKRGSTEINHTTLPDQALGWSAVGDDDDHTGVSGCNAYTGSQRIEPTRGRERVWIEGATVGQQLSAMLLPVPTGRIGPQIHADDAECKKQMG